MNKIMSKRPALTSLAALFCTLGIFTTNAAAQGVDVGINAAVRNEVLVRSTDETEARQAAVRDPVFLGDEIVSFEDSALQVLLKDETVFTVGPNCEMVIDEFVYDPATADGSLAATITRGAFRFASGNTASSPEDVEINTPVASMGVRGTMFEALLGQEATDLARRSVMIPEGLTIDPEFATLVVLRGPGSDNAGLNRDGAVNVSNSDNTVTLWRSGTAVFVPAANGPIIGPFPLSREGLERFSELLRTTPFDETTREVPEIVEITDLSGDSQDTGDFDFPWIYDDEINTDRPDPNDDVQFFDPNFPGPPICQPSPTQPTCP